MTVAAIETEKLSKTYVLDLMRRRRVVALQDLSLTVGEGEIFGLLGPNGAGKSTTIKLLLNLIRPSSGRASIFGHPPQSVEARRQLGFLPENPAPYEYLSGREFVTFAGELAGLRGAELTRRVGEVIEQVGMGAAAPLQIRRYSKGMIQRISLAQALVASPRLLVLDEPTSGLDVLGRALIRDIILDQRKRGTTVLLCSHIIPDVEALCDRVAVVIGGRLQRLGSVTELVAGSATSTEVVLERVSDELREKLTTLARRVERAGDRTLLDCDDANVGVVLEAALAGGAHVATVQRTRYSLETMFLEAVKQSGKLVGGTIQ